MGFSRDTAFAERAGAIRDEPARRPFPTARGLSVSRERSPDSIDEYLGFREELRTALRAGTPAALRACVRSWASPRDGKLFALIAQADQVLLPYIKRMILEEPRLHDLHDDARLWLIANEATPIRSRTIAPTDMRRTPRPRTSSV